MTAAEARERAEKIAAASCMWEMQGPTNTHYAIDAIAAALLSVREETIEECAGVVMDATTYDVGGECDGDSGRCYAEMEPNARGDWIKFKECAAAIRALKKEA